MFHYFPLGRSWQALAWRSRAGRGQAEGVLSGAPASALSSGSQASERGTLPAPLGDLSLLPFPHESHPPNLYSLPQLWVWAEWGWSPCQQALGRCECRGQSQATAFL